MTTYRQVKKQQQALTRCEKEYALEKLKKRRADTRRKIELGGLVIKSGMDGFSKAVILGALCHAVELIHQDDGYKHLVEMKGLTEFG